MKRSWYLLLLISGSALGLGMWGLQWGLPSSTRTNLFLSAEKRNIQFFRKLEQVRIMRYEKMGMNPSAYAGRLKAKGIPFDPPSDIHNIYSGFILRTHDADEQATLVMLSNLKPHKAKFYPGSYHYLGAYLYPLAIFLGAGHVTGLLHLVGDVKFYYANPEEMARLFLAARLWSNVGFMFSAIALFFLGRKISKSEGVAIWGSFFYMLAPAVLSFSKIGKPHIWAPLWSFLMILFCYRFKESQKRRDLLLGGIFMGLAAATTTAQLLFYPFLIWSSWSSNWKRGALRLVTASCCMICVFLILNPFFFFHLDDYRNELSFLSGWYPFKIRLFAIWDYLFFSARIGLSWGLFLFAIAGLIFAGVNMKHLRLRPLVILFVLIFIVVCFQMQAVARDPMQIRPFLAGLGLLAFFASWLTHQWAYGVVLRLLILGSLILNAAYYCAHFQSDRFPFDNATLASQWITDNVPEGSVLEHYYSIPTVDQFPPIFFERYKLKQFKTPGSGISGNYLVLNPQHLHIDSELKVEGYKLVQRFASSPLQKIGREDPFTNANFPIEIYKKI